MSWGYKFGVYKIAGLVQYNITVLLPTSVDCDDTIYIHEDGDVVIPLLGQILILFEMSYKYGSNNDKFLWQMYGNKNMGQYAAPPTHYFYQLYIWKPEKLKFESSNHFWFLVL